MDPDFISPSLPSLARMGDQDLADLLAWLRDSFGAYAGDGHDHER